MPHECGKTRRSCSVGAVLLLIALEISVGVHVGNAQQSQLALQITSPIENTVVNPGQAISLSVVSLNNTSVAQVFVIGKAPIRSTSSATAVPAQLSLNIPQQIPLRKYLLTAWGRTIGGQLINSAGTTIDVERPDLPVRLKSLRARITFASLGADEPLKIYATFSDSAFLDVTESSNIGFASSDPSIATVDSNGTVKPISQGTATITATYTVADQSVSVSVPVTVPRQQP